MKSYLRFLVFLLVFANAACRTNQGFEVYVSSQYGNDANQGTKAAPLASLEAAQQLLRNSGRLGKDSCKVVIAAGTYRLKKPLRFTNADSGSEAFSVIWQAADSGEVRVTAAYLIRPQWEFYRDGIFRTHLESGENQPIDQLFVNGERQQMARYPNLGAGFIPVSKDRSTRGKKAGNVPYDGSTPNAWDAEKASEWANPAGAFLHGMHTGLWGSQHYRVLEKNADGTLRFEGGWQNNRHSEPHKGYRMIENIFEELDAPGEWFYDLKGDWLYYQPDPAVDIHAAVFEAVFQQKHLLEFYGKSKQPAQEFKIDNPGNGLNEMVVETHKTLDPVHHIQIKGIRFGGTARTFMETKEPLLRSDWTIYRGGALHLRGTESILIENCRFEELGGNAVFVDGYARNVVIRGNRFKNNGASDVNLVGDYSAVRNPAFNYKTAAQSLEQIDTIVGPMNDEYPADCVVEDNLMTRCGRFEKQVAGVNLSMTSRITIRHNTISHTPRAAINICDGTWGGHLIEWNDCFETVLETHDHGAFNAWGRDRIWHSAMPNGPNLRDETGKAIISYYIEKYPNSPRWDPYQTTVIRNNRMQCDHGWDIDLDDGCTNYDIYNNLCLKGGLKTREGYYRHVHNNVILGGYTCNVPYPKPTFDVFERNIVWGSKVYYSSSPTLWGGSRNLTFVHNPLAQASEPAVGLQQETRDDAESLYGNARFIAPEQGNFKVADDSPARETGFKNFPMTGFGVVSENLKVEADTPVIALPQQAAENRFKRASTMDILGAKVKTLDSEAEMTATGMYDRLGAYLVEVPTNSIMAELGFKSGDVVTMVDLHLIPRAIDLYRLRNSLVQGSHSIKVWRNQEEKSFSATIN